MPPEPDLPDLDTVAGSGPLRHVTCGGGLIAALHDIGGVLVVALYGPLGPASEVGLRAAMQAVFVTKPTRIVIDASCITDCDRRGLGAFIDAAARAVDSGIPFALCGLPRRHLHLLQILWRPNLTAALSHQNLDIALSAVTGRLSRHDQTRDRTREELLNDVDELHQRLLDSRVVEQATGVLMAIYGCSADTAAAMLARHAGAQQERIPVLAGRLVKSVERVKGSLLSSTHIDALLDEMVQSWPETSPAKPGTRISQAARPSGALR